MKVSIIFLLFAVVYAKKRYDGYKLIQVEVPPAQGWLVIETLSNQPFRVDFWTDTTDAQPGATATFMVSPDKYESVVQYLKSQKIKHILANEDVQMLLDQNEIEMQEAAKQAKLSPSNQRWTNYHDLANIMNWVSTKTSQCGSRCSNFSIGNSHQNRELRVMKIGTPGPSKERLWLDAGIHAREWIAPAVAQYFIERLVDDYNTDADVKAMVDRYDIYIEPVVNPDGYSYSWTDDRLWRKSRQVHDAGSGCVGTDINRNFNHNFGGIGSSDDPCSSAYHGPSAYSEPEAKAINDFIMRPLEVNRYRLFFTMHSYSQLWMTPWGYSDERPPNYDEMMRVAALGVNALEAVNGSQYTYGQASEILYYSSGTSRDWAAGVPQMPYVYTIELRPERNDPDGFVLPPEQILPCVTETWAGFKAAVKGIMNPSNDK